MCDKKNQPLTFAV